MPARDSCVFAERLVIAVIAPSECRGVVEHTWIGVRDAQALFESNKVFDMVVEHTWLGFVTHPLARGERCG